jgi:hypothetical protein
VNRFRNNRVIFVKNERTIARPSETFCFTCSGTTSRKHPNDKRGDRRASHSDYETAIDAENDTFLFHYSLESTKAKKQLEQDYQGNLKLILEGTTNSSINSNPDLKTQQPSRLKMKLQKNGNGSSRQIYKNHLEYRRVIF